MNKTIEAVTEWATVAIAFILITGVVVVAYINHAGEKVPKTDGVTGVQTEIPTHVARCVKRSVHVCTEYEIYRVTMP